MMRRFRRLINDLALDDIPLHGCKLPGQMVKTPNFGQAEQDAVLSGENDSSIVAISKVLPLMGRITVHYYWFCMIIDGVKCGFILSFSGLTSMVSWMW